MMQNVDDKNNALLAVFHRLIASGETRIHVVPALGMIGVDNEGTVDGVHFTDMGFMRYAKHLSPYIDKYMDECGNYEETTSQGFYQTIGHRRAHWCTVGTTVAASLGGRGAYCYPVYQRRGAHRHPDARESAFRDR